jgi:hypothetical protein
MEAPALLSGRVGLMLALLSCAVVAWLASRFIATRLGRTPAAARAITWGGFAVLFGALAWAVLGAR